MNNSYFNNDDEQNKKYNVNDTNNELNESINQNEETIIEELVNSILNEEDEKPNTNNYQELDKINMTIKNKVEYEIIMDCNESDYIIFYKK